MNNLILTDADGVLLHWENSFKQWMTRHGYDVKETKVYDKAGIDVSRMYGLSLDEALRLIRMFNDSATIGWLPPLRDAIKYVKKLHEEHGFVFHVITSFTDDLYAYELRKQNLVNLFGPTAVQKIVILGIGESKEKSLSPYRDSGLIFIEDRIDNAELAGSMGLEPILMKHAYNSHYDGDVLQVENWRDIYDYVVHSEMPVNNEELWRWHSTLES